MVRLCYNILEMRRFLPLIILFFLLAIASFFFFVFSQSSRVIVSSNTEYQETAYFIINGESRFEIITYQTELNKSVMSYTSNAGAIKEQVGPMAAILKQVKNREGTIPPVLFWHSNRSYPEFFERVAQAAEGMVFEGEKNQAIIEIANQAKAYPELAKLFAKFGLSVRVSSVEKVLMDPTTQLPYDFMVWFRVEKKGQGDK